MSRNTNVLENVTDAQRGMLECSKNALVCSIQELGFRYESEGRKLYHENQEKTATEVATNILEQGQVVFQLVIAMTQTGKTGCMLAVIEKCFTLAGCEMKLNPRHVFVLTGLSSNDWREQTKERMPSTLQGNIFHRGELKRLRKAIGNSRDVLIVMDEAHIAAKENMSVDKMLKELGFKDMEGLCERNINFVVFSATPNGVLNDMKKWGNYAKKHIMQPGVGYKGMDYLLENDRVYQAKDLFIAHEPTSTMTPKERAQRLKMIKPAMDSIKSLKEHIITAYSMPKYHIIRTPTGDKADTVMSRFREVFGREQFEHIPCNSTSDDNEIQKILSEQPEKHSLIFIKEHLRCAVTLTPKSRIGILYERMSKVINDDVIVQGLAGRATGYDAPEDMIVYTNIPSLETYMSIWNAGFDNIADMTFQGSRARKQRKTFTHPALYENTGLEIEEEVVPREAVIDPNSYRVYDSYEKVIAAASVMGYDRRGVKPPKEEEDGFIKTSLNTKKTVVSLEDAINKVPTAYGTNKGIKTWRTYYPCYEDKTDANTLRFVFIIRPGTANEEKLSELDAIANQ